MITLYNIQERVPVRTPLVIVHGEASAKQGTLIVANGNGPPLFYEINAGFFKAPVHLEPGNNSVSFTVRQGNKDLESIRANINYERIDNKPVHLCLLLAKDSPGFFDTTSQKAQEEGNGIELAVQKLRVAARLMQAFTHEQMQRAGFGSRTFNFAEEVANDTLLEQEGGQVRRNTVKIHVIRSSKTLKELRDPNLAQQNSKGTNTGGLFGIAMNDVKRTIPTEHPTQAAVMFLDAHWDTKLKLILTHAALGGGDGDLKLAIFGSHGIFSWPKSLERVQYAFQDTTRSNINEVANDSNQCGTYWECLNITMGAFLHEIGHLLGSPHQVSGIMLRDYVTFNRSFTSREVQCLRTGSKGKAPLLPSDECAWHRLDLLRYLHHPSFALPSDSQDPTFGHRNKDGGPSLLPMGNGSGYVKSPTGIYAVEVIQEDLARGYWEYKPQSLGGQGTQHEIQLIVNDLNGLLPNDRRDKEFDIRILSSGGEYFHKDVRKLLTDSSNVLTADWGAGKQRALKSGSLGDSSRGKAFPPLLFDSARVVNVRVYWGGALDGVRFDIGAPPVPARDYKSQTMLSKAFSAMSIGSQTVSGSVTVGKPTNNYSDFALKAGEGIKEFRIRSGAWIDAIQIVTSLGRTSEMYGSKNGGGQHTLEAPAGFKIVGMFGSVGQWLDSLGIVYAEV